MNGQASSSRPLASQCERTTQAADKCESGLDNFKAGRLDDAVQLLGEALELHIDLHGDTALGCASSYHHYGAALFAKAQEESDVLGTSIRETAASPAKDLDKENRKGKGKMIEPEAADGEEDDDSSDAEDDGNDMQLAWEMLELAKLCYSSDASTHRQQLADVQILLGDIGMEQEAFDGALADYSESIQLLKQEKSIARKMAELHYKTALALQFLDEPEKALEHTNVAIGHCKIQLQGAEALPGKGTDAVADSDKSQGADLKGILVDLQAKADDLQDAIQQRTSTKNAMKAAFMQLAGSVDPLAQGSVAASSSQPPPAVGNAIKSADGAVRDLGVVGRGSKRIKLAPAPLSGADSAKPVLQAIPSASGPNVSTSRMDQLMTSSSTTDKHICHWLQPERQALKANSRAEHAHIVQLNALQQLPCSSTSSYPIYRSLGSSWTSRSDFEGCVKHMGYGPKNHRSDIAERFVCPPERSIPVPLEELLADFKGRISPEQHDDFDYINQMLEALAQLNYVSLGRRLKTAFTLFSEAACGRSIPTKRGSVKPSSQEIDALEQKFVEDIWLLLSSAHYRLLSQDEWVTALQEDFTFNMPVEVTWNKISDTLLKTFWSKHPMERQGLAEISDRILVFHRGIKEVRAQGMFINEKIDLLVQYVIVEPLSALLIKWAPTLRQYVKQANAYFGGSTMINNRHIEAWLGSDDPGGDMAHTGRQVRREINGSMAMQTASGMANRPANEAELLHANAKHVERVTLSRLMPDASFVMKKATSTLTIKEPAFQDIVILYRRKVDDAPKHDEHDEVHEKYDKEMAARNIHLKMFGVVPMADCEMLFPDKRVYIKPFVMIQLIVTLVIGFITALLMLCSSRLDRSLVISVLGTIFGRAFQVYTTAQYQKQRTVDSMTERLYEKTQDAQVGVLYRILNQMAEQHIKQHVMAYFILLIGGQGFTEQELDQKCEMYLERHFRCKLDFALENTLPSLMKDGLIRRDHQGRLQAVPMNEGIKHLTQKWTTLFRYSESGQYEGAGLAGFDDTVAAQRREMHQSAQPASYQTAQPGAYQSAQPAIHQPPVEQESWTRVSPYPGVESRPQQAYSSHNSSAAASQGSQSPMKQGFTESNYNPQETSYAARIAAEAEAEMRNRGFRGKIRSALHKDS
ncbi:hypothetical protein WJX74_006810 [Apatococcus lobatus]|uniref:Tetratricopeptide SHNi-TPR domain-containing protein n=1 Tax=Apatococcus lobatus TaxID=904363 RepID=A0AAW1R241_9CHLO